MTWQSVQVKVFSSGPGTRCAVWAPTSTALGSVRPATLRGGAGPSIEPWQVLQAVGPCSWQVVHALPALPPPKSSPWQEAQVFMSQWRAAMARPWKSGSAGLRLPGGWMCES